MNSLRSPRVTYAAAFFLGALVALLLVRPASAATAALAPAQPAAVSR